MTTTFILIEPIGTIKQTKAKESSFEFLYKKCGFRSENDFAKRTTWALNMNNEKYIIQLWAKNNGKANNENKYDFPPPVDKDLYFGTCLLVRVNETGLIIDLDAPTWSKIYEKIFGGFENIGNKDEEMSDDELEHIDKKYKTKHGYLKDGFIVDSAATSDVENEQVNSDEDDDDDDEEDDNLSEELSGDNNSVNSDDEDNDNSENYESNELEESEYDYSDDNE
jgi:hypothetical protein